MFVMMADVELREGAEEGFARWLDESNAELSAFPGFVSRRLLRSADGRHRIVVEHESRETFERMHKRPEHGRLHPAGRSLMASDPARLSFEVVAGGRARD